MDLSKTRSPVRANINSHMGPVGHIRKPEFIRMAEKEQKILKIHREFANEFDPSHKLTKKSESNLHSISFRPPLAGTSRPGLEHKESVQELKKAELRRALDHNYLNKRPSIPSQQIPGLGSKALNTWQMIDFDKLETAKSAQTKPPLPGVKSAKNMYDGLHGTQVPEYVGSKHRSLRQGQPGDPSKRAQSLAARENYRARLDS